MKKIVKYEIVDHGVEHSQYFTGCGVAFTEYDEAHTGVGNSLKEALDDAAEGMAMSMGYEIPADLEAEINAASNEDMITPIIEQNGCTEDPELYYYASIRIKLE